MFTVVDGFHLHVRTEAAVLGRVAQLCADGQEFFIQFLTQGRGCGIGEAGPAALAAVAVEGKLADHQHFAVYRFQT